MLVSIIMPVYNKENYLEKSILSVLNQTYKNIELVIINDGSTDKSEEIILKMMYDNRIKYYKQSNNGVSIARNNGIKVALGEFVSFLDADDYYDETFIEKMLNKIKDKNVCYCGNYVVKKQVI